MSLIQATERLAAGAYAIAVSGGADSVGLLHALHHGRGDLRLHVVHLDHQLRGDASAADAAFVRELAQRWGIAATVAKREEIEPGMQDLPGNASARYRAIRHELFRQVVEKKGLMGVVLAHHADDQAETILQRLLRGSSPAGLGGMGYETRVKGLLLIRPLLGVRRKEIRAYLEKAGQAWREDASNASDDYLRNRLRRVLARAPELGAHLLELGKAMRRLGDWAEKHAPVLGEEFAAGELGGAPLLLGNEAGRRWLRERGAPVDRITPGVVGRLLEMARDSASPPRQHFPGRILVRRRRGMISATGES